MLVLKQVGLNKKEPTLTDLRVDFAAASLPME
jgi:hypothetical protein